MYEIYWADKPSWIPGVSRGTLAIGIAVTLFLSAMVLGVGPFFPLFGMPAVF